MPTVTRSELNNADDIIREFGLQPIRRAFHEKPYSTQQYAFGCQGKTSFPTMRAAEFRIRRGSCVYHCDHCKGWHRASAAKRG